MKQAGFRLGSLVSKGGEVARSGAAEVHPRRTGGGRPKYSDVPTGAAGTNKPVLERRVVYGAVSVVDARTNSAEEVRVLGQCF